MQLARGLPIVVALTSGLVACGSGEVDAPALPAPGGDAAQDDTTAPVERSGGITELGDFAGALRRVGLCTTMPLRPGTVITSSGAVTGASTDGVWSWKGIPYATPPVGLRRWRPPTPHACWDGELSATAFGPVCPQLDDAGNVTGNEDCLTLNVWAPEDVEQAPVLVFIHGGGNYKGSASEALYDGQELARRTGSVVVTLDYRLGALGFFAHPGLDAQSVAGVSGNYGILDQIAALHWVRANITGFGGARDRVMIFGESAGGQDTLVHLASPLSSGLFQAALVESGGVYDVTLAEGEETMQTVVDGVGCTGARNVIGCMRRQSAEALVSVPHATGPLDRSAFRYTALIDGYVLPASASDALAAGTHNHVPLIIGTDADETSHMVPPVYTELGYQATVLALYGPEIGAVLLELYPASAFETPRKALVRLTTDVTWTCQARRLAGLAAASQSEPVFRYHFTWTAPGALGAYNGAFHGLELPFVFGTLGIYPFTPTDADLAMSASMQRFWERLAATGNPNGDDDVAWPTYDATDPYLELDTTITAKAGLSPVRCNVIDALAH